LRRMASRIGFTIAGDRETTQPPRMKKRPMTA
jgi:hypothetical protein